VGAGRTHSIALESSNLSSPARICRIRPRIRPRIGPCIGPCITRVSPVYRALYHPCIGPCIGPCITRTALSQCGSASRAPQTTSAATSLDKGPSTIGGGGYFAHVVAAFTAAAAAPAATAAAPSAAPAAEEAAVRVAEKEPMDEEHIEEDAPTEVRAPAPLNPACRLLPAPAAVMGANGQEQVCCSRS
jgi:hypothetical protein